MYFDTCCTEHDAKAIYRRLSKIHHPDIGGDTATMAAINAEYSAFRKNLCNKGHYRNQYQKPQQEQKKRRRKTIYAENVVFSHIKLWENNGGMVHIGDNTFYLYGRSGYKFIVYYFVRNDNGKSYYSRRMYNEIPKKYFNMGFYQ